MNRKLLTASKMLKSKPLLTAAAFNVLRAGDITTISATAELEAVLEDTRVATAVALAASGSALCDVSDEMATMAVAGLEKLSAASDAGCVVSGDLFDSAADRLAQMSEQGAREVLSASGSETTSELRTLTKQAWNANHPQNGGSAEALRQVKQAHEILTSSAAASCKPVDTNMKTEVIAKLRQTIAVLEAAQKMAIPPQAELRSKGDFERMTRSLRSGDKITIFFVPPGKASLKSRTEIVDSIGESGDLLLKQTRKKSPYSYGGPHIGFDINGPFYAASHTGKPTYLKGLAKGLSKLVPADPEINMGPAMASTVSASFNRVNKPGDAGDWAPFFAFLNKYKVPTPFYNTNARYGFVNSPLGSIWFQMSNNEDAVHIGMNHPSAPETGNTVKVQGSDQAAKFMSNFYKMAGKLASQA